MGITGEAVRGLVTNMVLFYLAIVVISLYFTGRTRVASGLRLNNGLCLHCW
jgi:hypothetical protein